MKTFAISEPDAIRQYTAWRHHNPNGFVVNVKPNGPVLHTASCMHLAQFKNFEANLLAHPKTCFTTSRDFSDAAHCIVALGSDPQYEVFGLQVRPARWTLEELTLILTSIVSAPAKSRT